MFPIIFYRFIRILQYVSVCLTLLAILPPAKSIYHADDKEHAASPIAVERTRAIALFFSFIQCFPNSSKTVDVDPAAKELLEINRHFDPETHFDEYTNSTDIRNLINFVNAFKASGQPTNLPFSNAPQHIFELNVILKVLFYNAENWTLFYNTSVWLLQRVSVAELFWAVMIVLAEKFSDTIVAPSAVEIFPQYFVPKKYVLSAAGIFNMSSTFPKDPLAYWSADPGLNGFHVHWHMDNPFWWDERVYGVRRDRRGELFLYFHHQVISRYNAELVCNGMKEVDPLELDPEYRIPVGYVPDIVWINFTEFFSRPEGKILGTYDDGGILIAMLRDYFQRLSQGIEQGFFVGPTGDHISCRGENGTNIVGNTAEPGSAYSANLAHYGSFHNFIHRLLSGVMRPKEYPIAAIQTHSETAMRDPVFYRIHKRVDTVFLKYKLTVPAYTKDELNFPGISILSVNLLTRTYGNQQSKSPVLTTYFRTETFDISTTARPCRGIHDEPLPVILKLLDYEPFNYVIAVQSFRKSVAYGMVRIFLWPEFTSGGKLLEGDGAHERAIELDRFRVKIDPGKKTVITRSSLDSSLTRLVPTPGIKTLYKVQRDNDFLTNPENRRACGFPNNLLIPRGSKEGVSFKLIVYLSDESDAGEEGENQYPHYPLCGALQGIPFPDKRAMGFPFDRPGTKFNVTPDFDHSPVFGGTQTMKNVKEIKVVIKHIGWRN